MSKICNLGIKLWELSSLGGLIASIDTTTLAESKGFQNLYLVRRRGLHYDRVIWRDNGQDMLPEAVVNDGKLRPVSTEGSPSWNQACATTANFANPSTSPTATEYAKMDSAGNCPLEIRSIKTDMETGADN